MTKVGFIGLGRMGAAMAGNIAKAGYALTVYNRTAAKAEELRAAGAHVAKDIASACCDADIVFTMLADDHAVTEAVFGATGILASLPKTALHVSSSTISVALSEKLTEAHANAGQRYLAAPVFGRPDMARDAKLAVAAAGPADALALAQPLLDAIGQKTFVLGEKPSAANLVKLSGNFLIASAIEALGEAIALAAKGGVDRQAYVELLTTTLFNAPVYKVYGQIIAEQKYAPAGFAAPLGLKDVTLALEAATALRVPLPLASLLRDRFLTLLAQGGGDLDWSAIATLAAKDSGQA